MEGKLLCNTSSNAIVSKKFISQSRKKNNLQKLSCDFTLVTSRPMKINPPLENE